MARLTVFVDTTSHIRSPGAIRSQALRGVKSGSWGPPRRITAPVVSAMALGEAPPTDDPPEIPPRRVLVLNPDHIRLAQRPAARMADQQGIGWREYVGGMAGDAFDL